MLTANLCVEFLCHFCILRVLYSQIKADPKTNIGRQTDVWKEESEVVTVEAF